MPSISSTTGMADTSVSKFTKVLPLSIRKEGGGSIPGEPPGAVQMQSEQKEQVRVTLTYPSPACGAMNPHKEIALRLTNDENPMFFFHLRITDADFPELKSQQGLLVDFYGFPNQLVMLLDKCDPNYNGGDESPRGFSSGGPKFVLVMKIGVNSTVLDIVESNPFKYLCHLSIQINAGSDGEIKKYLCDVTTGLKKDYILLGEKYNHLASSMENETSRIKGQLDQKTLELNQLRDELHVQASSLSTKHFQDMTHEKEKLLQLQSELASKFEQERNDLDKRQTQVVSTLDERISALESENRDLIQCKYRNETALQESGNKMKHYEDDLKLLQQEITLTRKQNEKLDHDYHEKQRTSNNLHNRMTTLEADLREKQNILQRQHEQLTQISEQKKFLEDHATAMVKEVEKVKSVNRNVSTELIKANEIIKKLQDDIRTLNSKNKLQSQITTEQERAISDRDKQIQHLETEINTINNTLSTSEDEVKKLATALQESESKLDTFEKTIKSNENMISWLNKQLNEFQGLSNLSKFRQNLGLNANSAPPTDYLQNPTNCHPSSADPPLTGRSHHLDPLGLGSAIGSTGGRPVGVFGSNQSHNTLPNGTPSWMHIYQSTSTPLEDDLSSRLEKVSASNGVHMNYKSRFTDKLTGDAGNTNQDLQDNTEKKENQNINEQMLKPASRPPTWAKGRGGKVTLEGGPLLSNRGGYGGLTRR